MGGIIVTGSMKFQGHTEATELAHGGQLTREQILSNSLLFLFWLLRGDVGITGSYGLQVRSKVATGVA